MTRFLAFVRQVYHQFTSKGGTLTAAAISYYGLVSVIPLILLAISLFGFALRSHLAGYNTLLTLIGGMVPWSLHDIQSTLLDIDKTRRATGIAGLLFLIWVGSQFFHALGDALNRTWDAAPNRPFWKGRLFAFGFMAIAGVLLLLNLALSFMVQWVQTRSLPFMDLSLKHLPFIWSIVAYAIPFIFSIITFIFIYKLLPNTHVAWKEAVIGGVFVGVLWEAAKLGFGFYARRYGSAGYNHFYGTLGGLILLVLWIYYTSNIVVIGGEVARVWCHWSTPQKPRGSKRRRSERPGRLQEPAAAQNARRSTKDGRRKMGRGPGH
ncbi:MAG TPA: YihY/virulence factor BrkB family protein [Armatimonadota bacterium]|nr:YihY/virulence factor BrkB family protein [Armatimonadota bacterium]